MDWSDSPDQATFRSEVASFIETRLPQRYQAGDDGDEGFTGGWQADRKSDDATARETAISWADALAEKGWIAPHWPKEYGGAGLSVMEQFIYNQEMAKSAAPSVGGMGVSLLGPTMIIHGSDEQKAEHLPRVLSGEVAWAQGYSEPSAGSDLASLQTRATRDGDDYVINGQKIWTSGAQFADWLFALVRTDPEAPKHRGISFIVMDIKTPGITVRPIVDMGWNEPFNETFFEDVRVPASNIVGEENRGWYVGMTLLDFERSGISSAVSYERNLTRLLDYGKSPEGNKHLRSDWRVLRHEVAERHLEIGVLFNFAFRIVSMQNSGMVPNYEASVNKMFGSEIHQRLARTGTKVFGLYANVWQKDGPHAPMGAEFTRDYIGSVPHTIFSGSSEIQRNVIATRGLGLPRG
ncbi:MAG: acyl-CoA dehydrogenase family protein [Chloroflexi bacterium]|nr:acyl-CoA dehydrogenase family protein [Chloroflexota bacterium]MDA1145921.1 acyl-CoA dehydrogenase family protein [Chloroflexota bacterium]